MPGGPTRAEVRRVVDDLSAVADVVGLTIAEFIPRDVLALRGLVSGMPRVGEGVAGPVGLWHPARTLAA